MLADWKNLGHDPERTYSAQDGAPTPAPINDNKRLLLQAFDINAVRCTDTHIYVWSRAGAGGAWTLKVFELANEDASPAPVLQQTLSIGGRPVTMSIDDSDLYLLVHPI